MLITTLIKEHHEVAKQVQKLKQQGHKEEELIVVADTEERILKEVNGGLRFETLDDQKDFLDRLKAVIFLKTDQEADVEEVHSCWMYQRKRRKCIMNN